MRDDPAPQVRLLVSDVDGTLVTDDKRVTEATREAAHRLAAAGVRLVLISARPPEGLGPVTGALRLDAPRAGFNGGTVLDADGQVLHRQVVPKDAVREAASLFRRHGIDLWVFSEGKWLVDRLGATYEKLERRTIGYDPTLVSSLEPFYGNAGKIVGTTGDFALLERCEHELGAILGPRAAAHRSQRYYLDVTHPDANKGAGIRRVAEIMQVPLAETAAIGDMTNDIGMLEAAGLAIAMGNGPDAVKDAAHFVTDTNERDGWARAIDRLILPRAAGGA